MARVKPQIATKKMLIRRNEAENFILKYSKNNVIIFLIKKKLYCNFYFIFYLNPPQNDSTYCNLN